MSYINSYTMDTHRAFVGICRAFVHISCVRAYVHDISLSVCMYVVLSCIMYVCMSCIHTMSCISMLCVHVYAHLCICAFVCTCICLCVRVYASTSHIRTYICCVFVGMTCVYAYIVCSVVHSCICRVCVYVCIYVCMHVCMYACMHVCMYACMHVRDACMHVCMCLCLSFHPDYPADTLRGVPGPDPGKWDWGFY